VSFLWFHDLCLIAWGDFLKNVLVAAGQLALLDGGSPVTAAV
jgi:hypothetical protein